MTDTEALLRAICAQPDEDTLKLAYADHLDELGGAERAARADYIRLHICAERMGFGHPERLDVARRIGLLRRDWDDAWARDLPPGFAAAAHDRRGAPFYLRATAGAVRAAGDDPRTALADTLTLTVDVPDAELAGVLKVPLFRRLRALAVAAPERGAAKSARALAGGAFPRLERLSLDGLRIGDTGLRALCGAKGFPRLCELGVMNCDLTDTGARALQNAALCARLRKLDVHGNAISAGALAGLQARLRRD